MDGATSAAPVGDFSIGVVLGRTFSLFGRGFLFYMGLGLVLLSPILIYELMAAPPLTKVMGEVMRGQGGFWKAYTDASPAILGEFVCRILMEATLIYGAFQQVQGKGFSPGETLKGGFGAILPVLGVSFLAGFAWILGLIVLVIPAFIVACALYVAVPVCVVERPGVTDSLTRSYELTEGARWKILGLYLLVLVVAAVGGGVIAILSIRLGGPRLSVITKFGWEALCGTFKAVLAVVVYHQLRVSKEGVNPEQIASVFD